MSIDASYLKAGLQRAATQGLAATQQEHHQQAEQMLEQARGLCPVDTGNLASSGRLETTAEGYEIVFDAPYAAAVHERLDVSHADGQAKFLEQPVVTESGNVVSALQSALNGAL